MNRKPLVYWCSCQGAGAGALVASLAHALADACELVSVHPGSEVQGVAIEGVQGTYPKRLQAFTRSVERLQRKAPARLLIADDPGVPADIYYARAGVLRYWLRENGGGISALLDSWQRVAPRLEAESIARARCVVSSSELVRAQMQEYYPEHAARVQVIYPAVDTARFCAPAVSRAQLLETLGLPFDATWMLFAADDLERHGFELALRFAAQASRLAKSSMPHLLVFTRTSTQGYRSQIKKLGIASQIEVMAPPAQPEQWLQAMQVVIHPTRYDPCSSLCLQALACGCPVVTHASNGAAEMIRHMETGYLLDVEAIDPLRKAVSWWMRSRLTPVSVAESVEPVSLKGMSGLWARLIREQLSA